MEEGTAEFRVGSGGTGWDQFALLAFELFNFRGCLRFEEIHQAAVAGLIGREAYARQALEQEFSALLKTKTFLKEQVIILPGAGRDESRRIWQIVSAKKTLDEHLREHRDRGFDLEDHFRVLYDQEVVPEMKRGMDADK